MKVGKKQIVFVVLLVLLLPLSAAADSLQLYAAGSLKAALGEVVISYEKNYTTKITTKFGPSGLLKKAILAGEKADIFASANMKHPESLAAKGWGSPVVLFARNKLCALAQPDVAVTTSNLLDTLLDENIRLGTSTPKADPSGDYAWELFARADKIKEGSFSKLSGKTLQLTGGPDSAKAPAGHNQYGWVMGGNKADVFLTYCTNAVLAKEEVPDLQIVKIPEDLAVGANYGLLINKNAPVEAWQFGMYILSPAGQEILKKYGFEAIGTL